MVSVSVMRWNHSPRDEQGLAVRKVSELGANPLKTNEESRREWDERDALGEKNYFHGYYY